MVSLCELLRLKDEQIWSLRAGKQSWLHKVSAEVRGPGVGGTEKTRS